MQRYLAQLLADIDLAIRNAPVASSYSYFRSPFDEEESDNSAMYVRWVQLCELFELSPDAFPPAEQLTKTQLAELLTAIEQLWRAWQISWECPPKLSARRRYKAMIEWMRGEPVAYHPERGASIDFCEHRQQGICPFGDLNKCWCAEIEHTARQDADLWEQTQRELDAAFMNSPVTDFQRWLQTDDDPDFPPWFEEDDAVRYRHFMDEDDQHAWLYFFRPEVNAELLGEEPLHRPEDFDDFDWPDNSGNTSSDAGRRYGRPGGCDDDPDMPF